MQKLIDIPGNDSQAAGLLESGVFPSLPAKHQKLWLSGSNVRFVDRSAEKAKGIFPLGQVGADIVGMTQAFVEGEKRVYFATGSSVFKFANGGTVALLDTFTGSKWSLLPWGAWLLATNDVDPVQVSKNINSMVPLANVPVSHARIIRKLGNRPIIFYGQEMAWPRTTDIEYWTTPDPTGRAGNFFIRDLDSDVVAVEPMGEALAFYTKNKMGLIQFIGGTSVYGTKVRLEGIGAIGLNAVIPVGARHYGMSATGIWVTDGSSFDYIDPPAVNRLIDSTIDHDNGDAVVGVHVQDRTTVEWHFKDGQGNIHGVGYNYGNGSWQLFSLGVTAAIPQEVFDNPIAAAGEEWGEYDKSDDVGAQAMFSSLTSGAFDAGEANRFKWWDMVQLNIEKTGNVEIRFGLHQEEKFGSHPNDEWLDWQPLSRENWIQRESVYLTMEIRSQEFGTSWRLGGLSVWGEPAGLVQ